MAAKFNVPYLGSLPMDPNLTKACERGESFQISFAGSPGVAAFEAVVAQITASCAAVDVGTSVDVTSA